MTEDELPFGTTRLMAAAERNDRDAVDALLAAGADINERSKWWAGSFGVLDTCAPALAPYLIERGAIVDAHAAARLGMIVVLRKLIEKEPALVNARGGDGKLPLHCASSVAIADLLLEHGADIDAEDIDHESTAAQHLIREHTDVAYHFVRRGCRTDVLLASALGDAALVHAHLDADAARIRTRVNDQWFPMRDPRAGGSIYRWTLGFNLTPPTVARAFGHDALFEELMSIAPADMALCIACEVADDARVDAILARNPSLVSDLGEPELRQLATMAELGNTDAALRMLAIGWPVDVRGQHRQTALHWAAYHGNAPLVKALVAHGAPIDAVEEQFGGTPADWAAHGMRNSWFAASGDYPATFGALRSR